MQGTFRLTKLGFTPSTVATKPKAVCLELRHDGPCASLERFCRAGANRGCWVSLFDTSKAVCPTSLLQLY